MFSYLVCAVYEIQGIHVILLMKTIIIIAIIMQLQNGNILIFDCNNATLLQIRKRRNLLYIIKNGYLPLIPYQGFFCTVNLFCSGRIATFYPFYCNIATLLTLPKLHTFPKCHLLGILVLLGTNVVTNGNILIFHCNNVTLLQIEKTNITRLLEMDFYP